jgi:hypothetical protein
MALWSGKGHERYCISWWTIRHFTADSQDEVLLNMEATYIELLRRFYISDVLSIILTEAIRFSVSDKRIHHFTSIRFSLAFQSEITFHLINYETSQM